MRLFFHFYAFFDTGNIFTRSAPLLIRNPGTAPVYMLYIVSALVSILRIARSVLNVLGKAMFWKS